MYRRMVTERVVTHTSDWIHAAWLQDRSSIGAACIDQLFEEFKTTNKDKGDRCECLSYRGICQLSIPGKMYRRVVTVRDVTHTQHLTGEEQHGFKKGGGYTDQVFALKNLCEKYLKRGI